MNKTALLEAAKEIARIGGDVTKTYFNQGIDIEFKKDASPVTIADQEAEKAMRAEIEQRFPDHGILGEEFGIVREDADIQWILDPIDGTKSFIHGVPLYTTLIGVLVKGEPTVGIIYQPILNELCAAAVDLGCTLNDSPCRVRECDSIENASMMITELKYIHSEGYKEAHLKLADSVRYHRTWGDAYGHMMVATGRADIMFDPILHLWDAAALHPIIREAGGWFGAVDGNQALIDKASGVSCHPKLKEKVLSYFK